jgi:hypothetical protein
MLRLRSPFWGFLRPTGPFLQALGCSHPAPILWLAQRAYGIAWYCAYTARFGAFYTPRGPFPGPWAVLIQPLSTGLPGVACRMPGAVLAHPIWGIFPPLQGPFCMGGSPIPHPFGCLQLCLHSLFQLFSLFCFSHSVSCPVHPVLPTLAAHTYFQEWWSHPLHTPQKQGGCNHPRCCIHIWETMDLVTSKQ